MQKIFITLDTETVGLKPRNYVYDFGYTIHNKAGQIFERRNWLISDVVTNPNLMMGAFYAKKIFNYYIPALDAGRISLIGWRDMADILAADIIDYDARVIAAYNAPFDIGAVRATNALLNNGAIVPKPVDMLCIWNYACRVLLSRPSYWKIAKAQNWISDSGNYRTTAEHTYRYITGDFNFIESHTALDDAERETDILAKCFAQKKKTPYNDLNSIPWRIAQEV